STATSTAPTPAVPAQPAPVLNAVVAPLTGLFYGSPSPGAEPYVKVGSPVLVGQVIGLIEAMKLFNEIKSDRAGRVLRVYLEDGALVKAKEPLIEVEP
ncbi:MAG: acetyl-CoA carboxylase biotin carboxyl carrier protein subunit, partial [Chloroflexota bacterium]|nr:acetyl-CoA carboxylase biotin carboxyl carrier protein subunit [Chloroflexota bacterium]